MIQTANIRDEELQTLKTLLLSDERQELLALRETVDKLTSRVGTSKAMQESVNIILSEALEQVSQREPAEISRTLAPLVMSSMKRQIKNSADDVIEIMYPLTGRMITAAVKNAINSLSEQINRQLETRVPFRGSLLKLRSRVFGLPPADLILAASENAVIERIMIVSKSTGHPIQVWTADSVAANEIENSELVTGMLAALNNLAEEAFETTAGNLRTLQLDGKQIALRSSATHLLILEVSGKLRQADENRIDSFFASWVDGRTAHKNPIQLTEFELLANRPRNPHSETSSNCEQTHDRSSLFGKRLCIAAIIGAFLAWPTWIVAQNWALDTDAKLVRQLISSELQLIGFPLLVEPLYESQSLSVTGLLPVGLDLRKLRLAWLDATDHRPIETNVRFVVTAPLPAHQW